MQSPTPRPESRSRDASPAPRDGGNPGDGDARSGRREPRIGAAATGAGALKLLDRRAAGRETATPSADGRAAAAWPPAGEVRRSDAPAVQSIAAKPQTSALHRAQLGLVLLAIAGVGATIVAPVPALVPMSLVCACLAVSLYLGHRITRPLAALADTSRAVTLGDSGIRATAEAGEFAEIARALNALLDERASLIAQNSEQQQRLQNDIHQLVSVVSAAAAGDFTHRAKVQSGSLGKLAEELDAALDNVAQLVHTVRTATGTMVEALAQCHTLAEHLNRGVSRQGSGLDGAAPVVRAVAERTDSVSENAQVARDASRRASEAAQEGGRMLQRLVEGMLNVRRNAQGSAARMKRLGERALEISTIIGAISRISAQTNMLALNAAIEASRAGEHGLGFTVVADEVRKLAEDCEEATSEIARQITAIQSETSEAVMDLERQAAHVEQQTQLANDAGGALDRILGVVQQSGKLVSEIAQTAQQQSDDAAGLREAIHGAGQVTREMQAASERAQRTLATLHATASELQRRVAALRDGGAATAAESGSA